MTNIAFIMFNGYINFVDKKVGFISGNALWIADSSWIVNAAQAHMI